MSSKSNRRNSRKRRSFGGLFGRVEAPAAGTDAGMPLDQLIDNLRAYQAELENQNKVLRYSQAAAEGASERFETLFASVPLALMVVDEYDMVVQSNAMAKRLFQPSERDRPLTFLMPFVSQGHVGKVSHGFHVARADGASVATEVVFAIEGYPSITGDLHIARIETPQEGEAPLVQTICAIVNQGPLLAERRALQQSAVALQQRNEQLRASERRLEAVINSALDAILCVDANRRITVFNPTAAALFQCPAADALGSPLERFLPDAAEALGFTRLSTQALLGEMTARTASGRELSVEVSASFERQPEGEVITVFARDLTGRKKAEAHRTLLETQLRESQKMQAMGTMAGGIAHDFNNILSAILGNVELARGDAGADSPAAESLGEIEKAGRRARDLVRQILTFSRNEPPARKPTVLAEIVHETERLLRVTLPPAVALRIAIHPPVPEVLADDTQVEQALLNLCTNAIHAVQDAPDGGRAFTAHGRVSVELAAAQPDRRTAARLGLSPGVYATLAVTDTGRGIDADTLQRIFEPFFTTKPVGQGTGLGLAVVHGVMRTHQGAIDVQSAPGMGSTFTLYFPAADAASVRAAVLAAPPPPPATPPAASGAGKHVMYVDDDQALVFLVERLLRRRGYRVTGISDPHAAVAALRADPQAYDLLVTDYNMPGFVGTDLVREARRLRADLPVAVASGYITPDIEAAARAEGARALIHKPNDVEELCATVQRLVAGEQPAL